MKESTNAGLQEYKVKSVMLDKATKIKEDLMNLLPKLQKLRIKESVSNFPALKDLRKLCSSLYK